ncbi:hypothetical protein [Streptomyces sp. MUM 178J]|uniref:hypothetical protein n=1 Tax=Streptomyces sp. MUM 178J TaxID=2791991 RepID=UPI001F04E519|nr:hypothetical protein [Streptomyces sp. MUM 178J]WRQ81950.1 hypothetical protein I3F59_022720 [Streptomyces sp. MUM 178J]
MQDWPDLLANVSFELQVKSDGGIHEADRAPAYDPVADSDAWHAFFGGGAGMINEWTPKEQPVPRVRRTYSDARAVVTSYRECTSILTVPASDGEAAVRQRIEGWNSPLSPSAEVEEPLPPLPPAIDFHRAVAMLREHPTVLQTLGLVFELRAAVDDLDVGTGPRFLRICGTDLPVGVTSPWTKYDLAEDAFWPAPADSTSGIRGGLLDLTGVGLLDWEGATTPPWALSTLDVEGAVRALRAEARVLDADGEHRPAMPSLRTDGLKLIRPDRESDFATRAGVAASRAGDPLANAEFTAEDLVLGYRVDIRVEDADWLPLCERQATYTVEGPEGRTITLGHKLEEGHIKPYAAVKTPDGRLHADEVVARWDGWSLAAPFMNLLGDDPKPEINPAQQPPYTFRWAFGPPTGRLPRLRFATRYQMRVRIADLTGGGPGLNDPRDTTGATDTIFYTRSDPIQPPRLSHEGTFNVGATIDQMVIRSDLDMDAAQFHAAHPHYPAVERRTLHPPTVSFALAEQHGKFDPQGPEDSGPQFTERTWKWALRALRAEAAGDPVGALPDPAANGISAHIPAAPGGLSRPLTERTDWQPWPSAAPKRIELSEQNSANPPIQLDWEGNALDIRLAKAEEAVLELSSTVRGDFIDHFSVNSWLLRPIDAVGVPPPIDQWQVTVLNGRHPLLSPIRRIHLVHAVRRPLAEPVWELPAGAVTRAEHDTNAVLRPLFSPAGLNTDSTGRLEISATWREWTNDGDHQQTVDHLHGETIPRGDPPALSVRHEFGDTKHRKVTYTLKAISRFRTYFDASDPDEAFQCSRAQAPVTIRSSARPPDLTLLSTTPSFRWQSQATATRIEHFRSSQRLRVELAGPWYETGEGECLAVLVAADGTVPAVPVTRLGRDPIFGSPPLPPLAAADWFAGFSERPDVSRDLGPSVLLVPYAVTREGDRRYTDIEITPPSSAPSYAPFVRLALARFQANSLPKLSLSPVVVSDPVRLLPDRRLVIERVGPDLHVSLLGTGPNPPNRLEVILEEAHAPSGVLPSAIDLVDVTTPPAADIPAWRPLSSPVTSDRPETPSTLRIPAGTAPLRLRVREVERLDAPLPSISPAELRDRTVFVDVIPLPAEWRSS